ncbi:MAG: sugar phosphate nucleotidyltransferase [Capsulimonadales bacterium]|nr:sugar phosphate nucleotidyltransferase [Capsulimonadales bacterium]
MKIRKAVITAASPAQRDLPLQTLVDRDGERKAVLCLQVAEMLKAGVEQVAVVVGPGDDIAYRSAVRMYADRVRFLIQDEPRGYGHALFQAAAFLEGEPFLHQVGDHLFVTANGEGAAEQIVRVAEENGCAVSGVQATRETLLTSFGTVGGQRVPGVADRYTVERVAEKPTPTEAEQSLIIPGLRVGHYLCFMGTHVLTSNVMDLLGEAVGNPVNERVGLSPVLDRVARHEKYLAVQVTGRRFHLDNRWGLLNAQLALALSGEDRDTVLTELVSLLATART